MAIGSKTPKRRVQCSRMELLRCQLRRWMRQSGPLSGMLQTLVAAAVSHASGRGVKRELEDSDASPESAAAARPVKVKKELDSGP